MIKKSLACAIAAAAVMQMPAFTYASTLEEIVVTAQKREQSLQDVPISVTAVSGDRMEKVGVTDTYDLASAVPNLNVVQALGYVKSFVRGVGANANQPGIEAPVSTYVDGVYYMSSPGSVMNFLDVERIEVLKGPQGTLFGRNATGGLIHVITKRPSQDNEGSVEVTLGSHGLYGVNLYATGGLSDNVAGSISAQYNEVSDGYGTNFFNGEDTYVSDETSLRGKLAIDLSDSTTLDLTADYYKRNADFAYRPILGVKPAFTASASLPSDSPWDTNSNAKSDVISETYGAAATLQHDMGWASLKSITAYRDTEHNYFADVDGTPVPVLDFTGGRNGFDEQFTQELQLLSSDDSSVKWVTGLYYMESESKFDPANVYFSPEGPVSFIPSNVINGANSIDSIALFGEATFSLTDTTSLTAGVRYTDEENSIDATKRVYSSVSGATIATINADQTLDFSETTWRLVLDNQITDDVLGFISYNRGFKSGGFNLGFPEDDPYFSEILDAYEIGLKSEFGGNLRLNMAAFYYDYQNPQIAYVQGGSLGVRGVDGNAKIYGFDADIEYIASDNLVLFGNIGILDHEYEKFVNGTGYTFNPEGGFSQIPGGADFTGNKLPQVPDLTATIGADYSWSNDNGEFGATINWNYNDGFFPEADNLLYQDSYSMVNASLRWTSNDERYRVTVWGKNLLDEEVSFQRFAGGFNGLEVYRPPLTFGVTVGTDF